MFHFDRGLKLTACDLAVDFRRRQPRGFISHAHTDHMAPHELALCTPATAALYRHRLGSHRKTQEISYRAPLDFFGTQVSLWPAGHVLGSAMLRAECAGQSLLYTGDFKLGDSATAEPAELPHADVLVMECTFGDPRYRLPPRAETVGRLLELVRETLAQDRTPVIHAYALGKAQEVSRLLTAEGIPVLQHPQVFAVSQVYEAAGCPLGDVRLYPGHPVPGTAIVIPPGHQRASDLSRLVKRTTIAVSGWAIEPSYRARMGVDHALPLSDHADYDDLLRAIEIVQPEAIYCTHGPDDFHRHLRKLGHSAFPLDERAGRAHLAKERTLFSLE